MHDDSPYMQEKHCRYYHHAVLQSKREQTTLFSMTSCSKTMKRIFTIIQEVAAVDTTVIIYGDSGTGKEQIAHAIHDLSNRKNKPFVALNCSALPDTLLESELFGYKSGAFTDAKKDKPGHFARAEGGTLFLDEIGDLSIAMQAKLLRVLQERTYEPLGATAPVTTDVRIVTATNKNLQTVMTRGSFRRDLFYRIAVVTITLPNLKERRCDIPLLCDQFIKRFNSQHNKNIQGITDKAFKFLLTHDFPGNIRELENSIAHAFVFCKQEWIDRCHLPEILEKNNSQKNIQQLSDIKSLQELECIYLAEVLKICNSDRAVAAKKLGIHKTTLFRKCKRYGL